MVPTKAPRGAFNVTLSASGQSELVWNGDKKGPPRADKFIADDEIVRLATAFVKKSEK